MAKISGTLVLLDVNGNPLAHVQDATLTINRELPDATDKDSDGWAEHLEGAGLRDWEITVNGWADYVTEGNVEEMYDLMTTRLSADIIWGPTEGVSFTGSASLANLELGAPNEETSPISGSLTGNGPLTKAP